MSKFYISTAIAYVNAPPHIGHALEFVQADVLARYHRLKGDDTFYLTGTDEHGVKIYETAEEKGMDTQEFVDMNAQTFKDLKETLSLSNDDFIQTSSARHKAGAQKIWQKMADAGDIYKDKYEGLYCVGCEAYVAEKDLDEEGKCPAHKKEPKVLAEENYFFALSKYSDRIKEAIESRELVVLPESRKNEMLNIIGDEGLRDVSFSRPKSQLPWGVDVPGDENQVMYVWCDALSNYITALDYENEGELWKKYWPADVHLIGKDILRFHAGIWIGMLMSAGIPIPKAVYVHGFITSEGQKMSKSLGNVVNPFEYIEKYGKDALRYYLMREIPTTDDGDFSHSRFVEVYNSELANGLGNLVNRVVMMTGKYFEGKVPSCDLDASFGEDLAGFKERVDKAFEGFNIKQACEVAVDLVSFGNKYIDEKKPWAMVKEGQDGLDLVMYNLIELLHLLVVLISPIIPDKAGELAGMIGAGDLSFDYKYGEIERGVKLGDAIPLFPRIEEEAALESQKVEAKVDFSVSEELIDKGFVVKAAMLKVPKVSKKRRAALKGHLKSVIGGMDVKALRESSILKEFKKFHEEAGLEGMLTPAEHLLNFIENSGDLPNINSVVECYNIVSAESLLSMGAHDLAHVKGRVEIRVTDGSEKYKPLGSNELQKVSAGEYACVDEEKILCRMDLKQCDETKVTDKTRDLLIYVQGNAETTEEYVLDALKKVCENVRQYCDGEYILLD